MQRRDKLSVIFLGLVLFWAISACHHRQPGEKTLDFPAGNSHLLAIAKYEKLGNEYYQRQRVKEAIQAWQLAWELDPSRQDLAERIKKAQTEADDGLESVEEKDHTATAFLDQRLRQELAQAETYYQQSQLKEAEQAWHHILTLDPQSLEALAGLDRLEKEKYQSHPARAFDRMTEELYQEGMRAFRQQNWLLAEKKLTEAAKLNPDQPQVATFLANVQQKLGQYEQQQKVEELINQALSAEQQENWWEAHQAWLEVSRLQPQHVAAAAGLTRTAQQKEAWTQEQIQQGQQALARGHYQQALTFFQAVLAVDPKNPDALKQKEQAAVALKQKQQQVANQSQAQQWFNLGAEKYQQKDLLSAIDYWQKAANADPQVAEYQVWLDRARQEQAAQKAKDRQRAEVRYADGLAAYQRGELEEALAAWRETLQLDPEHEKAKANIQQIERELH